MKIHRLLPYVLALQAFAAPQIEQLATDFGFTEGPALSPSGTVYFTDIPRNHIHIWTDADGVQLFREDTGGANGLLFDADGNLYMCEGRNRQLTMLSPAGEYRVLAKEYEAKALNSPNDLWIDPQGGIYFTDPRYGKKDNLEQDGEHVYYLSANGDLKLVANDLVRPNGIVGTPDGKTLYVADHGAGITYRYVITTPGILGERTIFAEQGSDGMALDEAENVYLTDAGVDVYRPDGTLLQNIELPERPANVTVIAENPVTLFVTARKSVYKVTLDQE